MKILTVSVFICMLYSCNQPTTTNQNGRASGISVFTPSDNENPEELRHIKQELVVPPLLPKHEQAVSGAPVVVEVTLTVEEKKLEIAPEKIVKFKTWKIQNKTTITKHSF